MDKKRKNFQERPGGKILSYFEVKKKKKERFRTKRALQMEADMYK